MASPGWQLDGPASTEDDIEPPQSAFWSRWNRFTVQRLKAWQPILAPRKIIFCYIAFGLVFVSFGTVLTLTQSVEEHVVDYTDINIDRHGVGTFDITVENDMEPPIWIYYQLDGFHQNHRRYIKSRSNAQLRKEGPPKVLEQDVKECYPWSSTRGRINYPCGVVAQTVFNDSYVVQMRGPQEQSWSKLPVDSRARTIAWPGDVKDGKFTNLDPLARENGAELQNQAALNMWLLERFPPVVCEQELISEAHPYVPVTVAVKNITVQSGQGVDKTERQEPVTDCLDYSGSSRCNFVRDGKPFACTGNYREVPVADWGIESGHFVVWMRIAGLPKFMKLWGLIDTPIKAGTTVRVHYVDNFPVKPFSGRKAFVMSTASMLGGRNDFLGLGYLAVGGCCLVFGLAFLWRHIAKPRALGDVSLLCEERYRNPKG